MTKKPRPLKPSPRSTSRKPQSERVPRSLDERLGGRVSWLFLGLFGLVTLVVFRDFLLLQKTYLFKDIGSDTLNVFYPQLVSVARTLWRSGLPGWSFHQGMGQNAFPNSLGDPFNAILYLLGPQGLAYGIAYVEILKLLIAGAAFYAFLRMRQVSGFTATIGGLLYAFNGSVMVGGTWYVFSTAVVHAALLLLTYELLFRRRILWAFALVVALIAASSAFNIYLFGVFLLVYVPLHYLEPSEQSAWRLGGLMSRVVGLGLIGLAMSAVFSLTSGWEMLHSPRIAGEASLSAQLRRFPVLGLGDAQYYATLILRGFGSDLLGTGPEFRGWQNYLEAPMHYCGVLSLLLAPQAVRVLQGRSRIAYGVVAVVLVCLHVFPWPRYAFWLFAGDYFRTLSLFASLFMLSLTLRALDAPLRGVAHGRALLGGTLVALLILLYWPYAADGSATLRVDSGLQGAAAVLLLIYAAAAVALSQPRLRFVAQVALLGAVVVELMGFANASLDGRVATPAAELRQRVGYNDDSIDALRIIRERDHGFYRVEKNYSSSPALEHGSLNDGKVQDFYGTTSYHSFNQPNYVRFLAGLGVIDPKDEAQTRWAPGVKGRPLLQAFASVRYWLVKGDWRQVPFFTTSHTVVDSTGDVTILRNENFIPLGFTLDRVLRESELQRLPAELRDVAVLNAVVIPDAAAKDYAAFAAWDPESAPAPYGFDAFALDARRCAANAMRDLVVGPNRVAGRLENAASRVLVLSIPFDPGWSARVDGKPTPLEMIDSGMTGLRVGAGSHSVVLDYHVPLRNIGALISALGCAALVGVWIAALALRRRTRHSSEVGGAA